MDLPGLPELHASLVEAASAAGFERLDPGGEPGRCCLGFTRAGQAEAGVLYVSAGIHGDEPAGPLALLELLREDEWPEKLTLVMFPLLNPEGYAVGSRTNRFGIDLNRDYRARAAVETQRHLACLDKLGRFATAVCLHEDWESAGVYLYEVLADGLESWAGEVLAITDGYLPRERATEIDGHPARDGVISYAAEEVSRQDRVDWPEAFWLTAKHTGRCYTVETPSGAPLTQRVAAHQAAVRAICEVVLRKGGSPQ